VGVVGGFTTPYWGVRPKRVKNFLKKNPPPPPLRQAKLIN